VLARQLGFRSPILWVYDPLLAGVGGSFSEKLLVYYVVDDYVEYAPRAATALRAAIAAGEAAMLDRADVVFAVSEVLYDRCRRRARNVHLVPNGVDAERFRLAAADPRIPDDIAAIPRPVVGYVGVIQSTMDIPLMTRLASCRPDWSFVLVGPLDLGEGRRELDALLARPNVHYLGQKSVTDVPYYIKSCDVCLMMDDERARGDVIKTYEYLAAGRPIVAKSTPSALRFGQLVSIASDARSFETAIAQALAEDGSLTSERMAAAGEHTWDHRVALIADAIEQLLPTAAPATRAADATSYGSLA
jgi:glycosyltransferase involved in cell wall biosynthesis